MEPKHRKKLLELGWVAVSLLLIVLWVQSYVHSRYEYAWESWLQLPWTQKLQPIELTLERYLKNDPAPESEILTQVSEADLEQAMLSAADWLISAQEPSGHFRYWYDPIRDEFSPPGDDSFHRQACAAYGLILAYEMSGNPRYLEGAQSSVEYLLRFRRSLAPDMVYFFDTEQADLGGAALPMLTMIKLRELTGSTVYDLELKGLANFLLFLQSKYDTGEFKSTYVDRGNYDIESELGWQSRISPGQAMLALAWMYRNFQDPIYKESIDRGLRFYSDEEYWKQGAFLPWTISAFVSIHSETGDRRYADYATMLTDYLISWQNVDGGDAVFGSFGSFPSISSASYLEGLGDAVQLTKATGDTEREAFYRRRALMGYIWLLPLQYGSSELARLPTPRRALGGFAHSRNDPQIRIDYNQHGISALVRGLRFVFGRQPIVSSRIEGRGD